MKLKKNKRVFALAKTCSGLFAGQKTASNKEAYKSTLIQMVRHCVVLNATSTKMSSPSRCSRQSDCLVLLGDPGEFCCCFLTCLQGGDDCWQSGLAISSATTTQQRSSSCLELWRMLIEADSSLRDSRGQRSKLWPEEGKRIRRQQNEEEGKKKKKKEEGGSR